MKLLATLLLALSCSLTLAKPIAHIEEPNGKLVLMDEKCTLFPDGYHFQAYNNKKEPTFIGCWIEEGDSVLMVSQFGNALQVPRSTFKWIVYL